MGSSPSTAGDAGLVGLSGQTTAGDELLSGGSATLESGQVGLFRVLDGRDVPKLLHDRSNISSLVERTIWHFLRGDEEVIYEAAHDRAKYWTKDGYREPITGANGPYLSTVAGKPGDNSRTQVSCWVQGE